MRIFQALSSRATHGLNQNLTWYRNLYEPLVDLGNDVVLFSTDEGREAMQCNDEAKRAEYSQKLLETFKQANRIQPFDLFFSYLMDGMVDVSVIDEIRKYGVPTCNFSCNNEHQFYLVDELSTHFDFNLHSEKTAADKFKAIGANPIWFPMAANPKYYHPVKVDRSIDVSFVGQCYAKRPYYIWYLLENGVNVQVFGPAWNRESSKSSIRKLAHELRRFTLAMKAGVAPNRDERRELSARLADIDLRDCLFHKYQANVHGPISDDEMIRKYSESKISLGFLEVYDSHNPSGLIKQHVHLREFEAPMCETLYFTGWCEELNEYYEPDQEIITYKNEHELLDKAKYYLRHPEEAEMIRIAGRQRAIRDHTYQKRYTDFFKQVGIPVHL